MKKQIAGILSVALAGIAAAYWIDTSEIDAVTLAPVTVASASFDNSAPVDARIAVLEQAVSMEHQARQLLQEEVMILSDEILRPSSFEVISEIAVAETVVAETVTPDEWRERYRRRYTSEGRADRLVASGFSQGEADWIVRRESELQMEGLQVRYDAQLVAGISENRSSGNALREELGDSVYERYLAANGRSTGISIAMVLEGSPALVAGLQVGDEIVNYGGRRVFSMTDLTGQILQGQPGQNVIVDIMRDGIPMQIVIPRGPIGITGGRRSSR